MTRYRRRPPTDQFPAATLTATFPFGENTQVIANHYQTGDDTTSETANIVLTGYYVAAAANRGVPHRSTARPAPVWRRRGGAVLRLA